MSDHLLTIIISCGTGTLAAAVLKPYMYTERAMALGLLVFILTYALIGALTIEED